MKRVLLCLALAAPAALIAADAKDEVIAAAKKLGEQANYTWKSTVTVPEGAQFRPGPTEGRTEKGGVLYAKTTVPMGDATIEMYRKGEKTVTTNQEGEWQVLEAAGAGGGGGGGGRGGFRGGALRNVQLPADQAADIAGKVKEFKKDGDAYVGDLTEDSAKGLMNFGGRGGRGGGGPGGGEGPSITGAKGSAKFWIKDGIITKYELKVSGKIDFNGNEIDMDRTTTTEISDIGKTKIEIPEGAKQKLS